MAKKEDALKEVKALALDMINDAKNGNMGITLQSTSIIYALYTNVLNILPSNPTWINRDRFIIGSPSYSASLYATLFMCGYGYYIEDLKRYANVDSFTPYAPELNNTLGIECSVGPAGEAVANAVGMALAERYYEGICQTVNKKCDVIDYYTFVLINENDILSGTTMEALSFAAKEKLNKLVIIYDNSNMTESGVLNKVSNMELSDIIEDLGFNIIEVKNGNNVSDISSALNSARKSDMPSFVMIKTTFGKDSSLEGDFEGYHKLLSPSEINEFKVRNKLNIEPFYYDDEVKEYISNTIIKRVSKKYENWLIKHNSYKESNNEDFTNLCNILENDEYNFEFDSTNYQINEKYCDTGINSNERAMGFIYPKTKFLLGGTTDTYLDNKIGFSKGSFISSENPIGRNIYFGKRNNAIGGILNGMAACNLRCFAGSYLTDVDKQKTSIRLSSQMKLPITYVYSHDSVNIGYEGAAFEPIEQLSSLRLIPNLNVFRPADINELIGSWEYTIHNKCTNAIVLSNEKNHILTHTNGKYVKYGAYIVRKEKFHLNGIIIATGSEVEIALKIAEELFTLGIDLRVVSMPCMELFLIQNPVYEEKLLPKDVKTITLEAGSTILWNRFATNKDCAIGIDTFGVSGSKEETLKFLNFDYNSLLIKIKKLFETP